MNYGKVLATVMIVLSVGACIGYALAGDVRRAVYWGAASILEQSHPQNSLFE